MPKPTRTGRAGRIGRPPGATLALAAVGAGVGAAALAGRTLDRRRVAADREHAFLRRPPRGRARTVSGHGGLALHVEEFGPAGAPAVVLIHGWTCQLRFWAYQLRDLAVDHRVIAYDLRGHGMSAVPDDHDLSTDALADDLDAVLDACLDPGERAVVAGHSLGAMTIAAWADRHPDSVPRRASAVVMVNTGLGDLVSEAVVLRLPAPLDRTRQLAGRLMLEAAGPLPGRNPVTHRAVQHLIMGPVATPGQVAFCENMILECPHRVRARAGRTLSRLDLHHAVERITVPSLVVAGEADKMTPMRLSERLAADLPACLGLVRLDGVGHMAPVEAPDAVEAVLRRAAAAGARDRQAA